ncbi:MAG: LysR family transcriptional regulator [Perlucidibaca sp.]
MNESGWLSRLDLNLFRVFDTIYRERNLTRAAGMLCLSQSAVSHALGRLRTQLGDPLFVREGQGVVPTPLADRLWPDIREALALFHQAVHRSQAFEPSRDISQITLAMNDELEPSILPGLASGLRAAVPEMRIASVRLDRASLRADLAAGRLDCAIDVAQPVSPELDHRPLLRDDFVVVSRVARLLDARDYLAARHVTVSSRRTGRAVEDLGLARQGLERQVVLRCQHYEAACRIVAESDLLLTMPRRQAAAINAAVGNAVLELPVPLHGVELHLYWHRQREADPANRWLRERVMAVMAG